MNKYITVMLLAFFVFAMSNVSVSLADIVARGGSDVMTKAKVPVIFLTAGEDGVSLERLAKKIQEYAKGLRVKDIRVVYGEPYQGDFIRGETSLDNFKKMFGGTYRVIHNNSEPPVIIIIVPPQVPKFLAGTMRYIELNGRVEAF